MAFEMDIVGEHGLPRNPFDVAPNFGKLIGGIGEQSIFVQREVSSLLTDRNGEALAPNELELALKRYEAVLKVRVAQLEALSPEERTQFGIRRVELRGRRRAQDRAEIFADLFVRPVMKQNFTDEEALELGQSGMIERQREDSDLITDHVLDSLGLSEWKPKNRSDRGWIYRDVQTGMRADAIPALKELWMNGMEELTLEEDEKRPAVRLLLITTGPKKGMVLVTRKTPGKKRTFTVTDLNSAIRMFDHIRERYDDTEIGTLAKIQIRTAEIVERLTKHWAEVKANEEERALIEMDLEEMGTLLSEKVRNPHKSKIEVQLRKCAEHLLQDKLGRDNPMARATNLSVSRVHAGRRLQQVVAILAKHDANRTVLRIHATNATHAVAGFYRAAEATDVFKPFLEGQEPEDDVETRRAEASAKLDDLEQRVFTFRFKPYDVLGAKINEDIVLARAELGKETPDSEVLQHALLRIYSVVRLIRLEDGIQELVDETYYSSRAYGPVNPRVIFNKLRAINRSLREHRHGKGVRVGGAVMDLYVKVYAEMRELMVTAGRASQFASFDAQGDELKKLERGLKGFSIANLMKGVEGLDVVAA